MTNQDAVDLDGMHRASLANQAPDASSYGDNGSQNGTRQNLATLERELAETIAKPVQTMRSMADAVQRAGVEQVPEAARLLAKAQTEAIDQIATEMENTANLLTVAARGLRQENARVLGENSRLLSHARILQNLTRSTSAAYLDVPRHAEDIG